MVFGIFVLNRVSILSLCLEQGVFSLANVLKGYGFGYQNSHDFCLEQGQGLKGRAAPPQLRIYLVPPGVILTVWMNPGVLSSGEDKAILD